MTNRLRRLTKLAALIIGTALFTQIAVASPPPSPEALNEAKNLLVQNPQRAREIANTFLTERNELANGINQAEAHLLIAASYVEEKKQAEEAKRHLEAAKALTKLHPEPEFDAKIELIEGRIEAHFDSDVPAAIVHFKQGLALLDNQLLTARLTKHALNEALGRAYNEQGEFELASQYMQTALKLTEKSDPPLLRAWTHVYLAQAFKGLQQSQQAIENLLAALSIAEEADNQSLAAYILSRLGLVYQQLSNYPRAQNYVERAAEIYQSLNDAANLASSLNFLGTILRQQGHYDTALLHYLNALELTLPEPNLPKLALIYQNIGQTYFHLDNQENAERYLQHSLDGLTNSEHKHALGTTYLWLAKLKYQQEQLTQAEEYAKQALTLTSPGNYLNTSAEAHELLATLFADQKRYQEAYVHQKKAREQAQEGQSSPPQFALSEEIYQQQQLQRTLQSIREEQELTKKKLIETSNWRNISGFISLSLLAIVTLSLRRYAKSQRQLKKLRAHLHQHPTTGLAGNHQLHDFLEKDITSVLRQHETFYSDNSRQSRDVRHFYFVIELPILKQIYFRQGYKRSRNFEHQFGDEIRQLETENLRFFQPRDQLICACLKDDTCHTVESAVDFIKQKLKQAFTSLELPNRQQRHSIGVISMPFLSKASRAIDSSNLPELLLLCLEGASQLRTTQGESSWVALTAMDAAPASLFNSDARSATLLGIRKGLVKVLASHDTSLIRWPEG